ncbi:SH3 domain-containing protein [Flavobacterium pedocola]
MTKYLKILLLFFPFLLSGQTFKRGLILPSVDTLKYAEKYCCVLTPKEGFTVYDGPKGNVLGKIKREINKNDDQSFYALFFISGKNKSKMDHENFREVGSDLFALNYTDLVDGYVKVLHPQKNYWLKIEEINKKEFKIVAWLDHLIKGSHDVMGYYANDPGLRIRKEPTTESEIITTAYGDLFEIKLTEQVSGPWCKAKITKYKEHPCHTELEDEENIENVSEGWIKVIADDGEPNLWTYKGC